MRITGGSLRSRSLRAPKGQATRPTSDRVREALFSILASEGLVGGELAPRVLDLYAGTGALSFEAISRGAREAVCVEHAREAVSSIRANAVDLDVGKKLVVVASRVDRALGRLEGVFDVIFLDPPYADVGTASFRELLAACARRVASGGALVLEHASADDPPAIEGLALDRSRRYGDTTLSLYRRGEP